MSKRSYWLGISLIVIVLWFIKKIIGSSSVQRVSLIPSSPSSLKRCEPLCLFYNTEEEEEQHPSITANMSSVLSSPMRCNPEFIFQTLPALSSLPPLSNIPTYSPLLQLSDWNMNITNGILHCSPGVYCLPLYSNLKYIFTMFAILFWCFRLSTNCGVQVEETQ